MGISVAGMAHADIIHFAYLSMPIYMPIYAYLYTVHVYTCV